MPHLNIHRAIPLVIACAFAAPAAHADTGSAVIAENAQERINFSGKLRMLSQRIPAAACHLHAGVAVEDARALLVGATAEFEKIIAALEFGDADLNIVNAETNRRTLVRIAELQERWEPLKAAANAVADGTASEADIEFLLTQNIPVLQSAQLLVETLVRQYANPNAATAASLMLIDISGRQRMLTQKMSKESCLLGGAYASDSTSSDLAGTMRIFEASLEALRFGLPEVGILPPPNAEISEGLTGVQQDWSSVKPIITGMLDGATYDTSVTSEKFTGLNVTMANMNAVVGLYTEAAK